MARILMLIALVWLLYVVIKRVIATPKTGDSTQHVHKTEEKIVQCSQCGMHVPESESLVKKNQVICNNPDCNLSQ